MSRFNESTIPDPATSTWQTTQLEVRARGPREVLLKLADALKLAGLTPTGLAPEHDNESVYRLYLIGPADRIDFSRLGGMKRGLSDKQ
jgi:hypothetical protein